MEGKRRDLRELNETQKNPIEYPKNRNIHGESQIISEIFFQIKATKGNPNILERIRKNPIESWEIPEEKLGESKATPKYPKESRRIPWNPGERKAIPKYA